MDWHIDEDGEIVCDNCGLRKANHKNEDCNIAIRNMFKRNMTRVTVRDGSESQPKTGSTHRGRV